MSKSMVCGGGQREFPTRTGTVKLFTTTKGAKLLIIPTRQPGPMFERDYDHDQQWMAERDFETIYQALGG